MVIKEGASLHKKGITLIAAVMLIIFASIAVLGVTTFIVERLNQSQASRLQTRCICLAQAGIHNAIYWFRYQDLSANGYFSLGQTNIDTENFFILSASAGDLLMVNPSGSYLGLVTGPSGLRYRQLLGWTLQNATDSEGITIASMTVTWSGVPPARRLQEIWLNNSRRWSGNVRSGDNCDIADFTLNTTATISDNRLVFNGSMAGATISIQYIMTDGSSKTVSVFPASNTFNFSVVSQGQTTVSNIFRKIRAEYNAHPLGPPRIISYSEQ